MAALPEDSRGVGGRGRPVEKLQLNPDGSLVRLDPGDWFVCFVPGIDKQWWHPFVHKVHKHVFAMRPAEDGNWTLFEPWWTRLLTATITSDQAKKFLRWGAQGDVLLVREAIPGQGSQLRGWMNCAALAAYMLGRRYWVWTPHGLYRRLLREPNVCHVDVSELLSRDLSTIGAPGSRSVPACEECRPDNPKPRPGAPKPFCMNCGRDLVDPRTLAPGVIIEVLAATQGTVADARAKRRSLTSMSTVSDLAEEQELRIRADDGRLLACLVIGEPGGRPTFYFHGFPGSRLEARLAAGAARRLGLRLIAPDRPGFGESTFQHDRRIGAWPADVAHIADALGIERFDVVGVSGGGPYALACAAGIPARIRTVVLVGALGPLGDSARLAAKHLTGLNRLALTLAARRPTLARLGLRVAAPWVRRRPDRYLKTMIRGAPPADREVLLDPAYRALFTDSMREALRQGGRGPAWELTLLARRWDFALGDVRLPVQLWHGLEDNVVPMPIARRLTASLPDAHTRYVPGEGHLSLIARRLEAILTDARR